MSIRVKVAVLVTFYLVALAMLCGCGFLNRSLGQSGDVPLANTPEAKEKAAEADRKAIDWLYWILVGGAVAGGAAAENMRQRRRRGVQPT